MSTEERAPGGAVDSTGPAWHFKESIWSRVAPKSRADAGRWAENFSRAMLLGAVFVVPTAIEPRTVDAFNLVKLTALWFFCVLAFAGWCVSVYLDKERRQLPRSPILRAAAALAFVTTTATIFSINRRLSFFGLYHRYEGLASLLLYMGFATLVVLTFRARPDALRRLAATFGVAAAVVSAYDIVQWLRLDPIPWLTATGGVPPTPLGSLGNPEFTGAFLGIAAPFVLYLARSATSRARRIAWLAAGAALLAGLWISSGRSGMLAAAVGGAYFLFLRWRLPPIAKLVPITLIVVALGAATLAIGSTTRPTTQGVLRTASLQYRAEMWKDAWRQSAARPVLGWGPETYYGNYARFRSSVEARGMGLTIPEEAHNIYLAKAAATGYVGLVAYLVMAGIALWAAATGAARDRGVHGALYAAFGAGFVAYLVQGLFSIDVPGLAFAGWTAIAGIAALAAGDRRGPPAPITGAEPDRAVPWTLIAACAGTVIAVVYLLFAGFRPLRADHAAWVGLRTAGSWSSDTMGEFDKARALNPNEAAYLAFQAGYLEGVANSPDLPFTGVAALQRAARMYEQAIALQPLNEHYMLGAARVYGRLGEFVQVSYFPRGVSWMDRAVALDGRNPQLRQQYADFLSRWARSEPDGPRRRAIAARAEAAAGQAKALREGPAILRH